MKLLFLFLDGVGLGVDDPDLNPLAGSAMPHLWEIMDGHKLIADGHVASVAGEQCLVNAEHASLLALDACLGVDGIPQSATGQASLLTGKNVSASLGIHEGPKPTPPIIELMRRGTVFTQLQELGKTASLINAFPPRYFEAIQTGHRLPGVIALSANQAGIRLKTMQDLVDGKAISADFTAEGWRSNLGITDIPILSQARAGIQLKDIAESYDMAIFEYWLTDVAGHHQDMKSAEVILGTLDAVIGNLLKSWDVENNLILLTSDHGNIEDLRTRHHTRHDVPLLLIGPEALRIQFIQQMRASQGSRLKPDLTDIAPAIVNLLGQDTTNC